MNQTTMGIWIWIGAIGGSLVGVLGGAIGTYLSIRNTQGPRERHLMIVVSALMWVLGTLWLVGLWLIPVPYRFLLWIPYPFLLIWGIRTVNERQARIRASEGKNLPELA